MTDETIAVIGGTGHLGAAIARRLAKAGRTVILGSRSPERAGEVAGAMGNGARGATNREAAQAADVVFLTVPFAAQLDTLAEILPDIGGKILIDTTVPLVPPRVARVQLPPEGSAAARAAALVGDQARLVAGFHNVAAHRLATDDDVDCDILIFGDDRAARQKAVDLADAMGLRGLHGGALVNAAAAEALTSILIFINKTYKVDGAGIRITGTLVEPDAG